MRYAKLKPEWLLRGWTDEPRTILNWKNGDCCKLSELLFNAATACNGQTDFDADADFLQLNILLNKLIAAGMAEECKQGDGVQPWQQYRKAPNPYVRSVHWSITGRCNLKCRHCYIESPDRRYGELPLPDILRIIGQFAEANVHEVRLTGGEPFWRRDLPDIMAALAEKQINVAQIYSNGVLINREVLHCLKEIGFSPKIQISFDGCGTHDAMRGVVGTETSTLQAVRLLREHAFPVTIATNIDRDNIGSLSETYSLMKGLDVQFWRVAPPLGIGNWRRSATGLSAEEILSACAPVIARWQEDRRPFRLAMPGFDSSDENEVRDRYKSDSYDCVNSRLIPSLLPDGTMLPCPVYKDTVVYGQMPNLLTEPFSEIWSESMLRSIIDTKKSDVLAHNAECAACAHFKRCGGGCRALAALATGNLMSVDPQICETYRNNYHQRLEELAGLQPPTNQRNTL
jgi:Fe-coproporphyrin III synthase